ncbi:putative MFS monocarboxylate transporter [Cladophialophora carrionii]|uniref:Putative MFS monocarboxylate transporter n=1 Tax=Cladophialophora carrionii TaxID=86049 RepID=A0A1C1CSV4_9EURO|nr:putative MFS monocarboxylate transporter [Cladophialophora carrionii]
MTAKEDEQTSALSDAPTEQLAGFAKDGDGSIPSRRASPRNFTQVCRILGTFFVFFTTWGVASSFSAYQAYYQQDLLADHTPSVISWIGTVQVALLGFTGIVSGALYDRGYIRTLLVVGGAMVVFGFMMLSLAKEFYQVILAQGVCIGLGELPLSGANQQIVLTRVPGNGMLYIPSIAVISQTFTAKQRPLAIGGSSSGAAIGGIVLPIMFRRLQPEIGFGWINRIFGFLILAMIVPTYFLLRPDPTHRRAKGPLFDPSAIREPPFVVLFVGLFFTFLGYWVPLIFVTPYAQFSIKTSVSYAFYLLAILNAGSFAGRILPALVAHRIGPAVVLSAGSVCLGILILGWIAIHDIAGITVWAVLVGFMAGITVAIPAAVVPLMSPTPSVVGARTGMAWAGAALAALIGGPIAGALVDTKTDNYTHGQAFGGAASLLGGLLLIYPAVTIARGNKRSHKPTPLPACIERSL